MAFCIPVSILRCIFTTDTFCDPVEFANVIVREVVWCFVCFPQTRRRDREYLESIGRIVLERRRWSAVLEGKFAAVAFSTITK